MSTSSTVLSVSQLNQHVRQLLEYDVGEIWVEGEISNLSKPSSGHFYFTLKDTHAQLRCVYFRNRHGNGFNALQNGQQVIAAGKLSLYEARGDFQLIVEQLNEAGQGNLYRQFELLKTKLAALGLFDPARKKIIPKFPQCIGVVTSATGAALHDILTTLARRFPITPIVVYASEVQGKHAAPQLIAALQKANAHARCDVLILARGGGSLEDLWAFNEESLAHAIASSQIPIVSGVGHETDFTIADFVADLRAATPTAAAEAVTPNLLDIIVRLEILQARLIAAIVRLLQYKRLLVNHAIHKISSPGKLIISHWQSLDYLKNCLGYHIQQYLGVQKHRVNIALKHLHAQNPVILVHEMRARVQQLENKLIKQTEFLFQQLKQQFIKKLATLHAVSPLATLDRGYAIVTHKQQILFACEQVNLDDIIHIQLARGKLISKVIDK